MVAQQAVAYTQELALLELTTASLADRVIFKLRLNYIVREVKKLFEEKVRDVADAEAGLTEQRRVLEKCSEDMAEYAVRREKKREDKRLSRLILDR